MIKPIQEGRADMVLGSRMMIPGGAGRGGMPKWKQVANRFLTTAENLAMGRRFSECHTGYRAYSRRFLETVPFLRNANGFVSQFGQLTGLKMGGTPKKFELLPYTVGKLNTRPVDSGNPLAHSPDPGASLGLDVKYAVTPGLTLTATANPDFGQVEADPAVVNLDAFETFFSERRPFFVEGSGTFRFNMDCNDGNCTGLFYSRRIGRAPQGLRQPPTASTRRDPTRRPSSAPASSPDASAGFLSARSPRSPRAKMPRSPGPTRSATVTRMSSR